MLNEKIDMQMMNNNVWSRFSKRKNWRSDFRAAHSFITFAYERWSDDAGELRDTCWKMTDFSYSKQSEGGGKAVKIPNENTYEYSSTTMCEEKTQTG